MTIHQHQHSIPRGGGNTGDLFRNVKVREQTLGVDEGKNGLTGGEKARNNPEKEGPIDSTAPYIQSNSSIKKGRGDHPGEKATGLRPKKKGKKDQSPRRNIFF